MMATVDVKAEVSNSVVTHADGTAAVQVTTAVYPPIRQISDDFERCPGVQSF